jgi:replicative DNA helicase
MSQPRIPPHDSDAEQSVLGAILIDKHALIQISDILRPEHFYHKSNEYIFDAMLSLFEVRDPIDIITLSDTLKKKKHLKNIGGIEYLTLLAEKVPTSAHVEKYAKIVKDLHIKRELIRIGSEIVEQAFDDGNESSEVLDKTEGNIFAISQSNLGKNFIPIRDTLADSFERLEMLSSNAGGLRGVPTGFKDLDDTLAGMQDSNLIILAARPGMGKTAFSLNIVQHIGVNEKLPVGIFSLEMSKEELVDRLLVGEADIDAWRLKTGNLKEQDFSKISDAMGRLAESPIFIDDTPGISLMEIRTKARRLHLEHGVKMIVVDYLQLMSTNQKYDNRVNEVSAMSLAMKNLARELKVPVLCLSQLSRAVEARGSKEPQLSDLRESGSIEQDADVVMFLYREDDDVRENVSLKVAKHRNGSLNTVSLYFKGDRIKFFGLEKMPN